jgi:hypothetical protein
MRHITSTRNPSNFTTLAELAIAAPQVIAIRTAQMLAAGATPNARDAAEFSRMAPEKMAAFGESMMGVGRQLMKTNQEYTRSIFMRLMQMWMTPWWLGAYRPVTQTLASLPSPASLLMPTQKQQQRAVTQLVAQAVAPVHKAATSNARRLIAKAAKPAKPAAKRATSKVKSRTRPKKRSRV